MSQGNNSHNHNSTYFTSKTTAGNPLNSLFAFVKSYFPQIDELRRLEAIWQDARNGRKQFMCRSLESRKDLIEGFCFCEDCRRFRMVNPSCNLRNCPRCQAKQSRRLYRIYEPIVKPLKPRGANNVRMLMLSGFRVDIDSENLREQCHTFFDVVEKYLAEIYEGGLVTLEWQWHGKELYVHAHALVYGGFKLRSDFGKEFSARLYEAGLITFWDMSKGYYDGQWHTWMETARSPLGGLHYGLKYVSKGVLLTDEQVTKLKGLRFVRTFGILRQSHTGNNYHSVCADCGGKIRSWFGPLSDWGPMDHPLKLKYVKKGDPPP